MSATTSERVTRRRGVGGDTRLAFGFLSPTLLVLLATIGLPIVMAIRQSMFAQSSKPGPDGFIPKDEQFVGLDSYASALVGENAGRFWNALGNTTLFTVVGVGIEVVLGVCMALIMHGALRGRGLVRASILVPWAIPTAVSALLWRWIFDSNGIANTLLNTQVLWAADGWAARFAVIIADTWKTAPFVALLVLAGLQMIDQQLYEAARVDGASGWRQFTAITLPLARPALLVAVLFRLMDNLRMFDLPYVLIGLGKPSVETLSMLSFLETGSNRFGPAAAYAVLLFVYVLFVAFVFVRVLGADLFGSRRRDE
ncbi:MAG: sugar ABC transporter permease [Microbacterium sp.]|uniref:carbohydrate ABC transporter permease n=1 Tax=Microbacterium sp. TaxID=51671 RepID=UPI0039E52328